MFIERVDEKDPEFLIVNKRIWDPQKDFGNTGPWVATGIYPNDIEPNA